MVCARSSASLKNHGFGFYYSFIPSDFRFGIRTGKGADIFEMFSSDSSEWIVAGRPLKFRIQSSHVIGRRKSLHDLPYDYVILLVTKSGLVFVTQGLPQTSRELAAFLDNWDDFEV